MGRWQEFVHKIHHHFCGFMNTPKNSKLIIRNFVDNWLERDLVTSSLNFSICESADSTRAFSASSKTTSLLSRFPSKLETFFWWRASL